MSVDEILKFVLTLFTGCIGWYMTTTLKQINNNQTRLTDRLNSVEIRVTVLETKESMMKGGLAIQNGQ